MPRTSFSSMPDDARLWIFPASRALEPGEQERLLEVVDGFLQGWKAHGVPLTSARDVRRDRFLLVAVDRRSEPPSGCSIDAMVRQLKGVEEALGLTLTDHGPVWWLDGDRVRGSSRPDFQRLAREGEVTPDTPVFDNTITEVGQLRTGGWEGAASGSWHGRAFWGGPPPRRKG